MSAGILAIWNDCASGSEAEYEHWYRTEHLAERVAVDGFVAGWRYVAIDAQPKYFTHYATEAVDCRGRAPRSGSCDRRLCTH